MQLNTPVANVQKIGPAYARKLGKLGIKEVRDLLFHFPSRYEDYSQISLICNLEQGQTATIQGEVVRVSERISYRRNLTIIEALIEDETDTIKAVWFNQHHIRNRISEGNRVLLAGKVSFGKDGLYLSNPISETPREGGSTTHTARLIPVYPETHGVTSRWFRFIISRLLPLTENIKDTLPPEIIKEKELMPLNEALRQVHFPDSLEAAEEAKRRFKFEELLYVQLAALKAKQALKGENSPKVKTDIDLVKKFVKSLPFELTDSQKKSLWTILKDMEKGMPMNRLLEGDVGSGKTVVAAAAALNTVKSGYQTAFMAPTEILAEQHQATILSLLGNSKLQNTNNKQNPNSKIQTSSKSYKLNIGLLTSSKARLNGEKITKPELKKKILDGEVDIIIGTHAVLQKDTEFNSLGFVVVDEQHRFGVSQRAALVKKGSGKSKKTIPHLLSMTATPIPRSLALTVYGDLDISLLKEMPKGRKKIITKIVPPAKSKEAYSLIKKELDKGRQAFVIFPLVEVSEKLEAKSAKAEYEKLKGGPFKNYEVGLLHGKMKPKEKEEIMEKMKANEINVLVATSVVEVGIDIPNASIMMIDGADRFGLAQLHQFRGRVGRSNHQSYCFLLSESASQTTLRRLRALQKAENGFELAEYDLEFRGSGDLYGVRQSGMPDIAMASLGDVALIEETRESASSLLEKDKALKKWPELKKKVDVIQDTMHFE